MPGTSWKVGFLTASVSLAAVGGAHAQTSERLIQQHTDNVRVVHREVVAPSAVVSRGLEEQPVWTHLVELKVNHMSTFIDPRVDYVDRSAPGGLDRSHSIVKAQRVAPEPAASARVIRGNGFDPQARSRVPQPVMIITKPQIDPAPNRGEPGEKVARLD